MEPLWIWDQYLSVAPVAFMSSGYSPVANIKDSYVSGGVTLPGAFGDGTTDDTLAIQHWLGLGGTIYAPDGNYKVSGACPFAINGTRLLGAGWGRTMFTIANSFTGDLFTLDALRGCVLSGFGISAASTRTAGWAVTIKGGDPTIALPPASSDFNRAAQHFIDIDMDKQFNGLRILDHSSTNGAWMVNVGSKMRQGLYRDFASAGVGILVNSPQGGNHNITDIFLCNDPTTPNAAMIQILGSGGTLLDGVNCLGATNECLINPGAGDPGSSSVMYVGMNNCLFDFGGTGGDTILIDTRTYAGALMLVQMSNMWIASGVNGIHFKGFSAGRCTVQGGRIDAESGYGVLGDTGTNPANIMLGSTTCSSGTTTCGAPLDIVNSGLGQVHFI